MPWSVPPKKKALGGTVSDTSAIDRNKGLEKYLLEHSEVVLNRGRALPANWDTVKAEEVFRLVIASYPDTTVVWNANDNMAMGVLKALNKVPSKIAGHNILVGGIDWNPDTLAAVQKGQISATLGGHFMECAWVVVLLNDYANKVDFANNGPALKSALNLITKANIDQFERALGRRTLDEIDRIDFKKFSRQSNPIKPYEFGLSSILSQLAK
jgi:ABC-type sugar transport system substrate-binding protein